MTTASAPNCWISKRSRFFLFLLTISLALAASVHAQEQDTQPNPPDSLTATVEFDGVSLEWDANTEDDLGAYNVYRDTSTFSDTSNAEVVASVLAPDSSYQDTSVTNSTEYFYRITALDTSGNESSLSNEVSVTTFPAAPQNLTATADTAALNLSWQANPDTSNLIGYQLYRADSSFVSLENASMVGNLQAPSDSTFTDAPVSPDTTYYYRITAVDTAGRESMASNETYATPIDTSEANSDSTAPGAPTNFAATADTNSVLLEWSTPSATDLQVYKVYRSTTAFADTSGASQIDTVPVGTTTYLDSLVSVDNTYYYAVTAVDTSGNEGALSATDTASPIDGNAEESGSLSAPTGLQADESTAGKISLTWSAVSDSSLAGYVVYRSQSAFTETAAATIVSGDNPLTDTTLVDTDVIGGITYYYRVVAVDDQFNVSELSNQVSPTAQSGTDDAPQAPSDVAANATSGAIGLTWTANMENDLAGYVLYRSNTNFSNISNATAVNEGGFISPDSTGYVDMDPGLVDGTTYYYRLTAVDTTGNQSDTSAVASATFSSSGGGNQTSDFVTWLPDSSSWTSDTLSVQSFTEDPNLSSTSTRTAVYNGEAGSEGEFDVAGYNQSNSFYTVTFTDPSRGDPPNDAPLAGLTHGTAMDPNHNPVFTLKFKIEADGPGLSFIVLTGELKSISYDTSGSDKIMTLKVAPVQYAFTPKLPILPGENYLSGLHVEFYNGNFTGSGTNGNSIFTNNIYANDILLPTMLSDLSQMSGVQVHGTNGEEAKLKYYFDADHAQNVFGVTSADEIKAFREADTDSTSLGDFEEIPMTASENSTSFDMDANGSPDKTYIVDTSNDTWSTRFITAGSDGSSGNTDTTAPSAPGGLSANGGSGEVSLNWTANSEADLDGYRLYRSTQSFTNTADATLVNDSQLITGESYTDTGLADGTSFHYRLTAVDTSSNESSTSSEVTATTDSATNSSDDESSDNDSSSGDDSDSTDETTDTTAPASPSGLSISSDTSSISVSWENNSEDDLSGYFVYRLKASFSSTGEADLISGNEPIEDSTYTDADIKVDTTYYYRITAVDANDNESALSQEVSAMVSRTEEEDDGNETDSTATAIDNFESAVPDKHQLHQAYPNPFNPMTTVPYGLPEAGHVRIDVYNAVGQRVATLVDDVQPAGNHRTTFQADDLPSGIYLIRMVAESYRATRSIMLVR